jgi:hypothetical protein
MPTSGSTDWTLNRDQVIKGALRKLVVIPTGGTPTANQIGDASDALNALVKVFQADGMPVWKMDTTTFTVAAGTNVYTVGVGQTVNIPKPLRVVQAQYTVSGGVNILMNVMSRYDFENLPSNNSLIRGLPVNLYYQPLNTTGVIKLWPTPIDSSTTISIGYQAPFEDMDNSTDAFDFPSEWIMPLIYNLAWVLAPEYGIPPTDRNILAQEAKYWHDYVLSMGSEEGSVTFQPDRRR